MLLSNNSVDDSTAQSISPLNGEFLSTLFPDYADYVIVASFPGDPGAEESRPHWAAKWAKDEPNLENPGNNNFFTVSLFTPAIDDAGRQIPKRKKELFHSCPIIVVDDVGTKISRETAAAVLPVPSYRIETSPGNEQWGFVLSPVCTDAAKVDALQDALVEKLTGGVDPGQKGVTRYARLPVGSNTKEKYRQPDGSFPRHRLLKFEPSRRYDIDALLKHYAGGRRIQGASYSELQDVDPATHPYLRHLHIKGRLSEGTFDITCPWVEDHTDQLDNGTAVMVRPDGSVGFECHHGHCNAYTGNDLVEWMFQTGRISAAEKDIQIFPQKQYRFNQLAAKLFGDNTLPAANETVAETIHITDMGHPDLSQDALARELSSAAGFGQNARYVSSWGKWVFWKINRWEVDEKLSHMTLIREFLKWKAEGLKEWADKFADNGDAEEAKRTIGWARTNAKALRQASNVNGVEGLARSNSDLAASPGQFDSDPMRLGTPDGTVDLKTGELISAQREDYITKLTAVGPAPSGTPAPIWDAFLDRTFAGNQELIEFMQRVTGYALTGRTSEHILLFFYGTGANGKSVFLNTLFGMMADYARRAPAGTFLDSGYDRHPTDLAGLQGARLVVGSELPPGKAWNESVVKDLTGGDVITARKMRQDFFEYIPQFTLMIAGNHQPSFQGIDEAIRRRVILIPFTQTIPPLKRDPCLSEKLKTEWPAILRWMINGCQAWQKDGLSVPQCVMDASNEYLDFEDTLGEFISENLIPCQGCDTSTADIYCRFMSWQQTNGVTKVWTKKAMVKALRERGFQTKRLTGGTRGFTGVQLRNHFPLHSVDFPPGGGR